MVFRRFMLLLAALVGVAVSVTAGIATGSDPFHIPTTPPETVITAISMRIASAVIILEGNVVASKPPDLLTCGRAFVSQKPQWMIATLTPRLYRKESMPERKMMREMTLDAATIRWDEVPNRINASDAVNVKIEERTWDLATYTWIIITGDEMIGFQASETLRFLGNVRLKDKDHFGKGEQLDYNKASSTAILSGNAYMETEEWNDKKRRMEKKTVNGNRIHYNTQTKEMKSE